MGCCQSYDQKIAIPVPQPSKSPELSEKKVQLVNP